MGKRDEHTADNVQWWMNRLAGLGESRSGAVKEFFERMPRYLADLQKRARDEGRPSRALKEGFSHSFYCKYLKDPERAKTKVKGAGYEFLKSFVLEADPDARRELEDADRIPMPGQLAAQPMPQENVRPHQDEHLVIGGSRREKYSPALLFRQLALFVDQGDSDREIAARDLPGLYKTYRPSLSRPGFIVVGLLSMRKRQDGLVETLEEARLQTSPNAALQIQKFEGCIAYSNQRVFFMMTDDNNSQFPRVSILQASQWEVGQKVVTLDGLYSGHNTRARFPKIVATHLYMERVHDDPDAREHFIGGIGYRKLDGVRPDEDVDSAIWERVGMHEGNRGIFEF